MAGSPARTARLTPGAKAQEPRPGDPPTRPKKRRPASMELAVDRQAKRQVGPRRRRGALTRGVGTTLRRVAANPTGVAGAANESPPGQAARTARVRARNACCGRTPATNDPHGRRLNLFCAMKGAHTYVKVTFTRGARHENRKGDATTAWVSWAAENAGAGWSGRAAPPDGTARPAYAEGMRSVPQERRPGSICPT
jgi:hypothetical protein